ncbi:hypothetical protein AVEN_8801-1, partial [Araneus ventricosus]
MFDSWNDLPECSEMKVGCGVQLDHWTGSVQAISICRQAVLCWA